MDSLCIIYPPQLWWGGLEGGAGEEFSLTIRNGLFWWVADPTQSWLLTLVATSLSSCGVSSEGPVSWTSVEMIRSCETVEGCFRCHVLSISFNLYFNREAPPRTSFFQQHPAMEHSSNRRYVPHAVSLIQGAIRQQKKVNLHLPPFYDIYFFKYRCLIRSATMSILNSNGGTALSRHQCHR